MNFIEKCYWRLRILFLGNWYCYINFGFGIEVGTNKKYHPYRGFLNWDNNVAKHLTSLNGMRILDIGCNEGLYALRMVDSGAKEVVGIDLHTAKAKFVKKWFMRHREKDYSCIRYIKADVTKYDLQQIGKFDLACMLSVAYHLGKRANYVVEQVAKIAPIIVMQGNLRCITHKKYNRNYYNKYAGVEGMSELLKQNGCRIIRVFSFTGCQKPLVIGYLKDDNIRS